MIKNYTSTIPASRSILHIEDKLVAHGAKNIMKEYEDERITSICFIVTVNNDEMPFKLPARTEENGMAINTVLKVKILESYHTQKDFAKKVGLSEHLLSRFINNREIPTVHIADKIANGLGVKTSEIFLQVINEKGVTDVTN